MKTIVKLLFSCVGIILCGFSFYAQSQNLDGSWEGKLKINPDMG